MASQLVLLIQNLLVFGNFAHLPKVFLFISEQLWILPTKYCLSVSQQKTQILVHPVGNLDFRFWKAYFFLFFTLSWQEGEAAHNGGAAHFSWYCVFGMGFSTNSHIHGFNFSTSIFFFFALYFTTTSLDSASLKSSETTFILTKLLLDLGLFGSNVKLSFHF